MDHDGISQIERSLANSAYVHGKTFSTDINHAMTVIYDQLRGGKHGPTFDGVRLHTGANRMSVMRDTQYKAYTIQFGLKNVMRPASDRTIRGIVGPRKAHGIAMIQIPFVDLGAVMDVDFLIID